MNRRITELKVEDDRWNNYHSKMLQMVRKELSSAWRSYKKLKDGYKASKPKQKDECNTFIYNQSGFKLIEENNKWYLLLR